MAITTEFLLATSEGYSPMASVATFSANTDWHRVQNKPSNLMKAAYEECKNNMYDDHLVSWFSTVMALANKLQIDLSVVKNWGEKKVQRFSRILVHSFCEKYSSRENKHFKSWPVN